MGVLAVRDGNPDVMTVLCPMKFASVFKLSRDPGQLTQKPIASRRSSVVSSPVRCSLHPLVIGQAYQSVHWCMGTLQHCAKNCE